MWLWIAFSHSILGPQLLSSLPLSDVTSGFMEEGLGAQRELSIEAETTA